MIDCRELVAAYAAHASEKLHCRPFGEGVIVTTPYPLPDGDLVELAIEPRPGGFIRVRDLGTTMGILIAQGFDPDASAKRRWLLEQAIRLTDVRLDAGELTKDGDATAVGALMLDVAVAARGVADLIYLHRGQQPREFEERVTTFLADHADRVDLRPTLRGVSGREYTLTARVHRHDAEPLYVVALSPSGQGQIKGAVDRTVRLWFDVNGELSRSDKVSFLNDATVRWPESDARLLSKLSLVVGWRARQRLVPVLRGAATDVPFDLAVPLWEPDEPTG